MTGRTWQENATEFAALTKQGIDIRLAALVACSVQAGKGNGVNAGSAGRNARNGQKASAREFAAQAGTSAPRVLRHLKAWDATPGLPPSETLHPSDVNDIDVDDQMVERYVGTFHRLVDLDPSGGRPRASQSEIIARVRNDPEYAAELAAALTDAVPLAVGKAVSGNERARNRVVDGIVEEQRHMEREDKEYKATGPLAPLVDAAQKLKQDLGLLVYVGGGKTMYEAVLERSRERLPWRPGELEAVLAAMDDGIRYGMDAKALLTPVSDEALADLLTRGEGER